MIYDIGVARRSAQDLIYRTKLTYKHDENREHTARANVFHFVIGSIENQIVKHSPHFARYIYTNVLVDFTIYRFQWAMTYFSRHFVQISLRVFVSFQLEAPKSPSLAHAVEGILPFALNGITNKSNDKIARKRKNIRCKDQMQFAVESRDTNWIIGILRPKAFIRFSQWQMKNVSFLHFCM